MRVELVSQQPDGAVNWIDVREKIKGGDIFAVHDAAEVPIGQDGNATSISYQGLDDAQFAALAHRLITAWSFQVPLPGSAAAARSVISDLEEDDFWKLHAALRPTLDKIKSGGPSDPKQQPTS